MRDSTHLFAFTGAFLTAATIGVAPVSQRATIQRHVLVGVTTTSGKAVTGLTARDLVVREDDIAREVIRVDPAPPPTHLMLLVDDTAGADGHVLELRRGLTAFVRGVAALEPAPAMSVMTFGDRPETAAPFTTSAAILDRAIQRITPRSGSGARFLEAIVQASRGLRAASAERPVIVAFLMEGAQEFSDVHYDAVASALQTSQASLWTVELEDAQAPDSDGERDRARVVGDLTRESGGANFPILSDLGLAPALTSLLSALTARYDVTYGRAESLIAPTRLLVETRDRSLRVSAPRWTHQ